MTGGLITTSLSGLAVLMSLASLQVTRLTESRYARALADMATARGESGTAARYNARAAAKRRWTWPMRRILGEP